MTMSIICTGRDPPTVTMWQRRRPPCENSGERSESIPGAAGDFSLGERRFDAPLIEHGLMIELTCLN